MKDKKIFKKWWFWVIIVIITLGAIGSIGQGEQKSPEVTNDTSQNTTDDNSPSMLPKLKADDYKGKEGLMVYKELKTKGYNVDATFENEALTDINSKASDLFEPLDPSKADDRQSVDAFIVGKLIQDDDSVILNITKSSN